MDVRLRILHLEDDATDSALVLETLEAGGVRCEITRVDTRSAFGAAVERGGFDLILADYTLPSFDGLSALRLATELGSDVPFIFVSGTLDEELAIETLKSGATDYVFKTRIARLVPAVRRALREADARAARAAAEEALRAAQAELAHATRVAMMGELAASLAHEIRQPMAAAVLSAYRCVRRLDRSPPDVAEARAAATRVVSDVRRASDIIDRVRALYARGAPGREPVDVNAVVRDLAELMRHEARQHGVTIRTQLGGALPPVTADRAQLQQVVMNLMLNGIEAMKEGGGELTVTSARGDAGAGALLVSVHDTGAGLAAEQAERIFDAFFTSKTRGTGMGLSISRTIIESHGGRLWARADGGPGATFQFSLPVAAAGAAAAAPAVSA
jgi:signal transduction histidine kinase